MSSERMPLPPAGTTILSLCAIRKDYGTVRALRDVSLEIPRGAIYGFLGPNGAGKTTTIRIIMNIILPDSGHVVFAGHPLGPRLRDQIGYLPEERGLYRKMRCAELLVFFAQLKGVARTVARARAEIWLERLELRAWMNRKVDELSKGMQQKLQFAATFLHEPDLVILDEPFSGLDPLNIELLRQIILEQREQGRTIIFSTHMLAEAEKICDAICLIEGGEKILDGTLEQVRQAFPYKSVRVAYEDGGAPPIGLPGVTDRRFEEGVWRLTLAAGGDPQNLLHACLERGSLSLYSANRPSLSEIFLTAVGRRRSTAVGAASEAGVTVTPTGSEAR